jgi:hypothetical protein
MNGPSDERVTEWTGGSLNELTIVLSAAALPARIRVFAPGPGDTPAGEVHLLAGGLNDAFAGEARGEEAVAALQRITGARFLIDTRLPDPETGSLAKPGPAEGNLAQRPLVEIMRYWRGSGPYQLPARRVGGNHGGRQRCARTTSRSHGLEGGVLRAGSALARDPACARALQAQHSFHGGGGCERGDATAHWRTRTASD